VLNLRIFFLNLITFYKSGYTVITREAFSYSFYLRPIWSENCKYGL